MQDLFCNKSPLNRKHAIPVNKCTNRTRNVITKHRLRLKFVLKRNAATQAKTSVCVCVCVLRQ